MGYLWIYARNRGFHAETIGCLGLPENYWKSMETLPNPLAKHHFLFKWA
jgi:hypothetical protein